MNSQQNAAFFTPVSAVVRFADAASEYRCLHMEGQPSKCFKGVSLFPCDMTGFYTEADRIGQECVLVIRFNADGTREVTRQLPTGWLDQYGHELALMQSLDAAAKLLSGLSNGGEYTITAKETVHDALPVDDSTHGG